MRRNKVQPWFLCCVQFIVRWSQGIISDAFPSIKIKDICANCLSVFLLYMQFMSRAKCAMQAKDEM